jgi:hypothetical protein
MAGIEKYVIIYIFSFILTVAVCLVLDSYHGFMGKKRMLLASKSLAVYTILVPIFVAPALIYHFHERILDRCKGLKWDNDC